MASKRIAKEYAECSSSPPDGISVELPNESDLYHWNVVIQGPANTVYEGGHFLVQVSLSVDYPFKPPTVTFATRLYHPNVTNDQTGSICLGMLKPENWKPASKLRSVLEAVRQLLVEPLPDDPLEAHIADEYRNNRPEFEKVARMYVQKYASQKPTALAAAGQESSRS